MRPWLVIIASLILAAPEAGATLLAAESFSYPDGPLGGQSGGTGWAVPWSTLSSNSVVAGGEAALFGPGTPVVAHRAFPDPAAPVLFLGFDLRTDSVTLGDGYSVALGNDQSALADYLILGKQPGVSEFVILHQDQGGTVVVASSGIPVPSSATRYLVGAFDTAEQRVSLWIDPDASDFYDPATGANSADASGEVPVRLDLNWLLLAVGGNDPPMSMRVDNLQIGDAPADVGLQATTPVPTWPAPLRVVLALCLLWVCYRGAVPSHLRPGQPGP